MPMQAVRTEKQETAGSLVRLEHLSEASTGCVYTRQCFIKLYYQFQLTARDPSRGKTDPRLPTKAATEPDE